MRRHPTRWRTRFASFVGDYTVAALARDLAGLGEPVTVGAVYSWVSGRAQPRLRLAEKVVRLSAGSLSLEDVASHRREIQDLTSFFPSK